MKLEDRQVDYILAHIIDEVCDALEVWDYPRQQELEEQLRGVSDVLKRVDA